MPNASNRQQLGLLRRIIAPLAVLAVITICGVAAPWISPQQVHDLSTLRLEDGNRPPAWLEEGGEATPGAPTYWLGTDVQGRDLLSAIFFGLRISLFVGATATALALLTGVLLGLWAGYLRGWPEVLIMRLADIQLTFPSILIAMFMMALWGQGVGKLIFAVALVHWVIYARTVRGVVLAEREEEYVMAMQALGAGTGRIMFRHLLPNLVAPVMVISAVEFSSIVMLEATLSFLGLGVPPTRPSLGMLINAGYKDFFSGAWWTWTFPGVALLLLILSINVLSDRLRDAYADSISTS